MLKEIDQTEAEQKYRQLKQLIEAAESMPKQIKECKLKTPPFIPKEFRQGKMPSNLFFSSFEFTMMDLVEHIKELKDLYERELDPKVADKIKKGG